LNPENPSSGFSTPDTINKAIIKMEVVSMLKTSLMNKKMPIPIIAIVMYKSIDFYLKNLQI
jgi:hypothetical protein